MRKFFIPLNNIKDNNVIFNGDDYHHIINVLRKRIGDVIRAVDGFGNELEIVIIEVSNHKILGKIINKIKVEERKISINLFQCLPKIKTFEFILEKTCELGINNIYPVISERSIYKDILSIENKFSRWQKIINETMKKIGRNTQMSLKSVIKINEISNYLIKDSLKILPWELEEKNTLKNIIKDNANTKIIDLAIGAEGGFSIKEVEYLRELNFITISLGKRILKVETAAIITIGNIYYELEL